METLKIIGKSIMILVALALLIVITLFVNWSNHTFPFNLPPNLVEAITDSCTGTGTEFYMAGKIPVQAYQNKSQECFDKRFNECIATDKYTREECISIASRP